MAEIFFERYGHPGKKVILLHGFPMNQRVWKDFAISLSDSCQVYTPDLPGLGKSEKLPLPFSIEQVADALLGWIDENELQESVVIGHSLGGYVALALVDKRPHLFSGLGLFHSTAYADTAEKKESRTKVVEFIEKNGVQAFTSNFIQPLFADPGHPSIAEVREITMQASADAVKGYTLAMRDRPERISVLKNFDKPILFIAGSRDTGIPPETISKQSPLAKHAHVHILENIAHMGMFEKRAETVTLVKAFVAGC